MFKDNVVNTLNDTVMQVTFPMLAQLQDDKTRLKAGYVRIMQINTFTIFPLITILILIAEPLIIGLLGEKWRGSIIFLQVLGISGYVRHLHRINLNVLKVYGQGRDYVYQGLFRNGITITGVAIAANFSAVAMAWAYVVTEFLQLFVNVYYSNKYIKFNIKEQLVIMLPLINITFLMGVAVYLIGLFAYYGPVAKLFIMSSAGILIYIFLAIIFKVAAFTEFKYLMLNRIRKK